VRALVSRLRLGQRGVPAHSMFRGVDCEGAVWIEFPVRNCWQGIVRGDPEGVQFIRQSSELVLLFDGRRAFTAVEGGAPCDPHVPEFEFAF